MVKIFSGRIYRESLRQTRVIGIVITLISIFLTNIVPVWMLCYYYAVYDGNPGVTYLSANNFTNGVYSLFAFVVPFILILKLFGFLFKRGASDFYHALPYTRQCIYISNLMAAVTWYVISIASSVLLAGFFYGINRYYKYDAVFIIENIAFYLIIMLYITGALLLAVSACGKPFVAVTLGLCITFIPRVLMLLTLAEISEQTVIINFNYVSYFSMKYNLIMEMICGSGFDTSNYEKMFSYLPGMLVTLAVALVYILLGLILFYRRKSEVAENAAPNIKVQIFFQCIISMLFFFGAVLLHFEEADTFSVILIVGFGIFIYLIYSLITTKSFKTMLKTIPGLVVMAVVTLIYFFSIKGIINNVLNNVPSADDIKSVSIYSDDSDYYTYRTYNEILICDIVFDNSEITNIIAQGYANTCKKVREKGADYRYYTTDWDSTSSEISYVFKINYKNGKSVVRTLYFDETLSNKLQSVAREQKNYSEAYYAIPKSADVSDFTDEHSEKLWQSFKAEYNQLTDEQKAEVLYDTEGLYDYEQGAAVYYLTVYGYCNGEAFSNTYCITEDMPNTYKLYSEYKYAENSEEIKKALELLKDQSVDYTMDINLGDGVEGTEGILDSFWIYVENYSGSYSDSAANMSWYGTKDASGDEELSADSEELSADDEELPLDYDADDYDSEDIYDIAYDGYSYGYGNYEYIAVEPDNEEMAKISELIEKAIDLDNLVDTSKPYTEIGVYVTCNDADNYEYYSAVLYVNYDSEAIQELADYAAGLDD